jgi:hypothetical protein
LDVTSFARASLVTGIDGKTVSHRDVLLKSSESHSQLLLSKLPACLLLLHLLHRQLHADSGSENAPALLDERALLLELAQESSTKEPLRLEVRRRFGDVDRSDRVEKLPMIVKRREDWSVTKGNSLQP